MIIVDFLNPRKQHPAAVFGMMEISRRADYGVRIMLELGKRGEDKRTPAADLVRATSVPRPFLHKIVADLARAGLIRTFQGPTGGLELGRPASKISMLDILEAIEGPVCFNICLLRPHECPRDRTCPAHTFWGRLQALVIRELQSATLDRMVEESYALQKNGRPLEIEYVFPAWKE